MSAGGWGPGAGEAHGMSESISHFRELQVWQRGMDIVQAVYEVSGGFPKTEIYGLTSQLRRAAVSVPSNIAEGHTRASTKEYLHHLSMAQASRDGDTVGSSGAAAVCGRRTSATDSSGVRDSGQAAISLARRAAEAFMTPPRPLAPGPRPPIFSGANIDDNRSNHR
jgi:hypothetical protein